MSSALDLVQSIVMPGYLLEVGKPNSSLSGSLYKKFEKHWARQLSAHKHGRLSKCFKVAKILSNIFLSDFDFDVYETNKYTNNYFSLLSPK